MSGFTGVTFLELDGIKWSNSQEGPLFTLTNLFPKLQALRFWRVEFDTFDQFTSVISAHQTMKRVYFSSASCRN
jgi:hypothetical protein